MNASINKSDLPRERLVRSGATSLSTAELLSILIGYGVAGISAHEISRRLLNAYTSLTDVAARDVSELRTFPGMGTAKACTLAAAFELAQRLQAEPFNTKTIFSTPENIAKRMIPLLRNRRTEVFHVLLLNSANQLIREVQIAEGSLNSVIIHPREVFRLAIVERAAAIVLVHNHPSGNTEPSQEDLAVTRQIVEAGKIIDIRVLDHIIVAGDSYTSLAQRRMV